MSPFSLEEELSILTILCKQLEIDTNPQSEIEISIFDKSHISASVTAVLHTVHSFLLLPPIGSTPIYLQAIFHTICILYSSLSTGDTRLYLQAVLTSIYRQYLWYSHHMWYRRYSWHPVLFERVKKTFPAGVESDSENGNHLHCVYHHQTSLCWSYYHHLYDPFNCILHELSKNIWHMGSLVKLFLTWYLWHVTCETCYM